MARNTYTPKHRAEVPTPQEKRELIVIENGVRVGTYNVEYTHRLTVRVSGSDYRLEVLGR